ncbi:hypothetical protein [Bdellovibrio sp. HCB337]|uniref:hypothetical protein n=1 Tax=Bdellovibrio sp. HCB337 TaxID=3394358 RepID=UPI0039A4F7F0
MKSILTAFTICLLSVSAFASEEYTSAGAIEFSKYKIDGLRLTKKIRDTEGYARYFTSKEALQYCKDIGGELPTARQYATLGIQLGAKGIRETSFPNLPDEIEEVEKEIRKMRADGYEPVRKFWIRENGEIWWWITVVDFYYNYAGFPEYSGDFGADSLWTYSGSIEIRQQQYIFNGPDGSFGPQFAAGQNSIRCLLQ